MPGPEGFPCSYGRPAGGPAVLASLAACSLAFSPGPRRGLAIAGRRRACLMGRGPFRSLRVLLGRCPGEPVRAVVRSCLQPPGRPGDRGRDSRHADGGIPVYHRPYDGGAAEVSQVTGAMTALKDLAGQRSGRRRGSRRAGGVAGRASRTSRRRPSGAPGSGANWTTSAEPLVSRHQRSATRAPSPRCTCRQLPGAA